MATTKNTKGKEKTLPDPNALRVEVQPDDNHTEKLAALATDGALTAITLRAYAGGGKDLGVTELLAAMRKAGDETVAGNMGRFERVLTHQFLTLDALFNNLAQRSGRQESFKGIEVLMRLALKAQSQARATAETLALMKNPMPYIKQANIAHGPQQVNNGAIPEHFAQARARGRFSNRAKQTIGGKSWSTAGHWSAGSGRQS